MKPLLVILAGGLGKSFYPLSTNKTLFPFLGKPLLQHIIEMSEYAGFQDALIITNEDNESWLSTYQPFNITLRTKKVHPNGMGGAVIQAEEEIGNKPTLIVNAADMIEPIFFKSMLRQTLDSYAYVTGLKVNNYFPGGYLKTDGTKALEIIEKPGKGKEPSDLLNLMFHFFSEPQDFISILKKTPLSDIQYEQALSSLMNQRQVDILRYPGQWHKLKYAHDILGMMNLLLKIKGVNHRSRTANISKYALLIGNVYVDEDASIDEYSIVKGPSYIGKGVKIGNHSLVRQSCIEEGSVVGFGSEVVRSYIGPNCKLHHNFIGDSILESDINPSWNTTFANWRLDQQNIRIDIKGEIIDTNLPKFGAVVAKGALFGVNCSVMPGITIGKNAHIYPNKIISKNIEENEKIT